MDNLAIIHPLSHSLEQCRLEVLPASVMRACYTATTFRGLVLSLATITAALVPLPSAGSSIRHVS